MNRNIQQDIHRRREQIALAVDEIAQVCRAYDVYLFGASSEEGIYSEIIIGDNQNEENHGHFWDLPDSRSSDVCVSHDGDLFVEIIGKVRDPEDI